MSATGTAAHESPAAEAGRYPPAVKSSPTSLLDRAPLGGPGLEILDTNTIFNDLIYQLRHQREVGLLIRSAREGVLRLFATSKVLEEVRERAVTQERRGVSAAALLELFERCYLPEIRFVDISGVPVGPRVLPVGEADPDDLPTAQLALLLAPCHVYTDDSHLTEAGFGEARNWLSLAQSAERAMQLDQTMLLVAELIEWAYGKAKPWIKRNVRELGMADVLLGLGIGLLVLMVLPPAGHAKLDQAIRDGRRVLAKTSELTAGTGIGLLAERGRHQEYLASALVKAESTPTLEQRVARELALRGPLQVAELSVAIEIEVAEVDAVLKSRRCFVYDQQGWWLGRRLVSLGLRPEYPEALKPSAGESFLHGSRLTAEAGGRASLPGS